MREVDNFIFELCEMVQQRDSPESDCIVDNGDKWVKMAQWKRVVSAVTWAFYAAPLAGLIPRLRAPVDKRMSVSAYGLERQGIDSYRR